METGERRGNGSGSEYGGRSDEWLLQRTKRRRPWRFQLQRGVKGGIGGQPILKGGGQHPSFHYAKEEFFAEQKRNWPWLKTQARQWTPYQEERTVQGRKVPGGDLAGVDRASGLQRGRCPFKRKRARGGPFTTGVGEREKRGTGRLGRKQRGPVLESPFRGEEGSGGGMELLPRRKQSESGWGKGRTLRVCLSFPGVRGEKKKGGTTKFPPPWLTRPSGFE